MFKINLQGDEKAYTDYCTLLKQYEINIHSSHKYSRRNFSSLLFEKVIKNLTHDQIMGILEDLEVNPYYRGDK